MWLLTPIVELNLYHKHKRDSKVLFLNEYSWALSKSTRWTLQSEWMHFRFAFRYFDRWIFWMNIYQKWTAVTCLLKVATFIYEWSLDLLSLTVESLSQTQKGELFKIWTVFRFVDSDLWLLKLYHQVKIKVIQKCNSWLNIHKVNSSKYELSLGLVSLTVESLSQRQKGHKGFSLGWIIIKHGLLLHVFKKGGNFYLQIIHWYDFIQAFLKCL